MEEEKINNKYKVIGLFVGVIWYLMSMAKCQGGGTSSICSVPIFGFLVKLPMMIMLPVTALFYLIFWTFAVIPSGIVFVIIVIKIYDKLGNKYGHYITIPTIFFFPLIIFFTDEFSRFIYNNKILHTPIVLAIPFIISYFYTLYPKEVKKLGIGFIIIAFIAVSIFDGFAATTLNKPGLCDLANDNRRDFCHLEIARHTSNPEQCFIIEHKHMRANCLISIAHSTKNPAICEEIKVEGKKEECRGRFR